MHTVFRRLRGALGTALTWSVAWVPMGVVLQAAQRREDGAFHGLHFNVLDSATWAIAGAVGGLVFSMLTATDGRRTLQQISLKRSAIWGAFSAIAIPLAMVGAPLVLSDGGISWWFVEKAASFGVAGAITAAGMVWLARRAQGSEPAEEMLSLEEEAAAALLEEANPLVENVGVPRSANVRM
jgi:hypothetical protein